MSEQSDGGRARPTGYTAPSPADGPTLAVPAAPGRTPPRDAATEPAAPAAPTGFRPARSPGGTRPGRTKIGGTWVGLILGAVVLVFLLVFILQNLVPVEVAFLGLRATLPLGIWLLFAAVAGLLLLAIPGLGRMVQWRRASRSSARTGRVRR